MYFETVTNITSGPNGFGAWKRIGGDLAWFRFLATLNMVAMVAGGLLCPGRLTAQEADKVYTRAEFDSAMKEVRQFKYDQLSPAQQKDTESWLTGMDKGFSMLNEMAKAYDTPKEELRDMLFEMVEGMEHDDAADLRLQICMGWSLNPTTYMKDFGGLDKQLYDRHVYFHSSIAEAQVRDWCQHPEKVERAVWFQTWVGMFPSQRGGPNFMSTAQKFNDDFKPGIDTGAGSDYWVYARLFVFSACVTNRRDLYAGVDPTKLQPQYIKWRDWLHSTFPHMERWRASGNSPSYIFDPEGVKRSKEDAQREYLPKLTVVPKTPYPTWGNLPAPDAEDVEASW